MTMACVGDQWHEALTAAGAFALCCDIEKVSPCGNGHINHTFVLTSKCGKRYILQILNTDIFKNPHGVIDNILAVTNHIRGKLYAEGKDVERGTLKLIPTKKAADIYYHIDGEGRFWRAYDFVEGTVCRLTVDSVDTFEKVGYAFGQFQNQLADFDASVLIESIPDFHHTPKRYAHFVQAVANDPVGRGSEVKDAIDWLRSREEQCHIITDALANGDIPLRVTHNDTKLSNILLDAVTEESVCIIDLDTVMPGAVLYDFGDAIRSGASTAAEDEQDLSKVEFRADMFCAFAKGFLQGMGGAVSQAERALMPHGAWTMIYEQAIRFMDDYLSGDTYYHIDYPTHNLVRAKNQMKLLWELESQMQDLKNYILTL